MTTATVTVTLQDAQARLPELIERLSAGERLLITKDDLPVAELSAPAPTAPAAALPRMPGSAKGILTVISEDDEHLEHFKEYMPE